MCPMCMTSAAVIAAGSASGVGVLGFIVFKFRALRRRAREFSPFDPHLPLRASRLCKRFPIAHGIIRVRTGIALDVAARRRSDRSYDLTRAPLDFGQPVAGFKELRAESEPSSTRDDPWFHISRADTADRNDSDIMR